MMWGRKKAIQTTSSASSISSFGLNTWLLRLKKTRDRVEPVSDDGSYFRIWLDKERYEKDVILHNSDYPLNLSPESFKKTASPNGRKMREFIDEDVVKSTVDHSGTRRSKLDLDLEMVVEEEWRKLKNMKINEIMLKSEKQRKSVKVRKETRRKRSKCRRKVNAFSPRVECRVKALEDMKRTRLKTKEKPVKDAFRTGLDSFAIVKSSYDPQRDFRDSMIEMIIENGIRERDELEELLACYLILNCDEYHHLIIKVFQQVWLELNHFDPYYLADF